MSSAEVLAQGTTRWVGTDYTETYNKTVFLYNVGTGRFLVHGGDWGTQARLFNEDYGKTMTPTLSNGRYILKTGVNTGDAAVLGCNVPQITSTHAWKGNGDQETFTLLMDANEHYTGTNNVQGYRSWNFVRVGEGDGTYTYYMYETLNGTNYWLGAAYGENGPDNAAPGEGHEGDPVGKLCLLASGYDKAVWSTADPRTSTEYPCQLKSSETAYLDYDDASAQTVNRSMQTAVRVFNQDTFVPLNDLYKWRIVTEEQFLATLNMTDFGDGLSTNLTWEITDRGFERNDNNFFDNTIGWKTGRVSGVTYGSNGRYGYTWGLSGQSTNNQTGGTNGWGGSGPRYANEPWNAPVRLKTQWTDKNNAKYGFMEFEGAGTVSTYITATVGGVYRISCYGFYQGSNAGYLFATTTNPQGTTAVNPSNFITTNLKQVDTAPYRNQDKDEEGNATRSDAGVYSGNGVMLAGATFVNDFPTKDDFYREVTIKVNAGDKIYFGVGKNGANQSSADVNGYYHDTEYVGVDQFNIHYLGTDDPILFDEDKYDWSYLPATPANVRYRTIRLKRDFKTGQWNSFVFPYDMTAVQVRQAFGDQTRVAELDGLGTITDPASAHDANVIDFKTIELPAEGVAIKAHVFYLIKPSLALPEEKNYYDMGTQLYKKEELPSSVETKSYGIGESALNAEGHNTIISKATYWATTDYDNFNNNNLDAVTNKVYAPAKSYVISGNKMYYIKNANRIKGFRGWIEDVDAPGTTGGAKLALNGIIDENEISGIDDIVTDDALPVLTNGSAIYDLSGRKVAVSVNQLNTLPKGMYIVNGKKYIVK